MLTGRARMVAGINRLTGRDDCREAVMLTTFRWGVAAQFGLGFVTMAAVGGLLSVVASPSPVVWAIAGGAGGAVMGYVGRRYAVLGRAGDDVVLARSKRLYLSPVAIAARWQGPKAVLVQRGLLFDTVELDGQRYRCAWSSRGRLGTVLAPEAGAGR